MGGKYTWQIGNGQSLTFDIYYLNTKINWRSVGGIYVFAARTMLTEWRAVYIGQTDDFSIRLPSHERRDEAMRNGATAIHAFVVQQATERDRLERLLIQYWQPQLNTQLR
jgi:excinuclease UvrABC nuclease subunit